MGKPENRTLDLITDYNTAYEELVREFVRIYYTFDDGSVADYYIIGRNGMSIGPVEINDMYWDIDTMYEALLNGFSKKVVMEWYDYCATRKEKPVVFVNFCRKDV